MSESMRGLGRRAADAVLVVVPTRDIWYEVYDIDGTNLLTPRQRALRVGGTVKTVSDFVEELVTEQNIIAPRQVLPSYLQLYANPVSYEEKLHLPMSASIESLGATQVHPLVAVAPVRTLWYAMVDLEYKHLLWQLIQSTCMPKHLDTTCDFLSEVHRAQYGMLTRHGLERSDLKVYADRKLFDHRVSDEPPLEVSASVRSRDRHHTDPMVVEVPVRTVWYKLVATDGGALTDPPEGQIRASTSSVD